MDIPVKTVGNFSLPVIGLGTWGMGGYYEREYGGPDTRYIAAIASAIDLGITHIDVAEIYAQGRTEVLVGQAIKPYDRSVLIITSKVHPDHASAQSLVESCERSLERLQTPYIDLYLLHAFNQFVPIAETMKGLERVVEKGYVKHAGVSNFSKEEIMAARTVSALSIVNNQIHYSLEARGWEDDGTLAYCEKEGILVTAYRPISQGKLLQQPLLVAMAKKYGKTPAQVALNWIITKPNVVALVKSTNREHLEENLGAIGWRLEDEDTEILNTQFPRGQMAYGPRE